MRRLGAHSRNHLRFVTTRNTCVVLNMEHCSTPETSGENGEFPALCRIDRTVTATYLYTVVLHRMSRCSITLYPGSTVVKAGRGVNHDERSALESTARLGLPIPRVYSAEQGPRNGEAFIHMDFVPGETLDVAWPSMTIEGKDSIVRQLREILTTIRALPSETGPIGSCSGGEARDSAIQRLPLWSIYGRGNFQLLVLF